MARAKQFTPDESIIDFLKMMKPANPLMSVSEKRYFKNLKKRGYSEEQIKQVIVKSGYSVPADFFLVKTRKPKKPAAPAVQTN